VFTDGDVVNKRKLILIIFLILSIVITGTLAYFSVVTERSALVLVLGEQDEVLVTLEPFEIKGTLMSVTNYTSFETNSIEDDYIEMTAENFSSVPKKVIFYYRINDIDDSLVSTSLKYTITSSSEINGTYTEVTTGNFSSAASGFDMAIYEIDIPANSTIFYRVFTYLDGNTNVSGMAGALIDAEFRAEMDYVISPDLDNGMIPVTLNYSGSTLTVKTVYSSDENWFDYENHKWANVVLVKENNRANYIGTSGVTINQSDILAYYVWIPRYRYQLFNTEFNTAVYTFPDLETMGECSANCEQTIFIEYEKLDDEKVQGTQNGQMLTHPAFTFGETELNGLWVAKFEPSADVNSLCYTEISLDNCNNTNQDLRILPGVSSLRYQYLSTQYFSGQKFASTTYLTETGVNEADSHIAKNIEWGAIAYLSNSSYGKNSEIAINNVSGYFTGGGEGKAYLTNTEQSSNGNITGIYDISGGCFESVMGNYNNTAGNSGLDMTTLGDYVDIYDVLDASGSILGDAIGETGIWYSDYNVALNASSPWYIRGGYRTSGVYAGAFAYNRANGQYSTYRTFRPIMIAK